MGISIRFTAFHVDWVEVRLELEKWKIILIRKTFGRFEKQIHSIHPLMLNMKIYFVFISNFILFSKKNSTLIFHHEFGNFHAEKSLNFLHNLHLPRFQPSSCLIMKILWALSMKNSPV